MSAELQLELNITQDQACRVARTRRKDYLTVISTCLLSVFQQGERDLKASWTIQYSIQYILKKQADFFTRSLIIPLQTGQILEQHQGSIN